MENISITTLSSRGQIVIPQEMRVGLVDGEKFVIMRNKEQFILKKVKDFNKNIEEDLEFARRTEEAWKEYDEGKFISMSEEDFLKEMKTWATS